MCIILKAGGLGGVGWANAKKTGLQPLLPKSKTLLLKRFLVKFLRISLNKGV